jgi:hypothetical protein
MWKNKGAESKVQGAKSGNQEKSNLRQTAD